MSAPVVEPMLKTELWVSFLSLLRSYAAAASLNSGAEIEATESGESIAMVAGSARLEMECDSLTGTGNWRLASGGAARRQGSFALLPDGRIELDENILELDHAAIDLAAALMHAGAEQ